MFITLKNTAQLLGAELIAAGHSVVTAESCTGGLVASTITEIPGSSTWFHEGYVTYSNSAKTRLLNVCGQTIETYGAVSKQVAESMLTGAITCSNSDVGIAITGIAGPSGGTTTKPVGTVWIAWGDLRNIQSARYLFDGSRSEIRVAAAQQALENMLSFVKS